MGLIHFSLPQGFPSAEDTVYIGLLSLMALRGLAPAEDLALGLPELFLVCQAKGEENQTLSL